MITLRTIGEEDWQLWRHLRLEALREAPYAFGSTFDDWQGPGDTELRWRRRLKDVPLNLIAHVEETPAGMVSATSSQVDQIAELISLWVVPFARGRGVGDALVKAVIQWVTDRQARRLILDVTGDNHYATALYRRHGFTDEGFIEGSGPGSQVERRMSYAVQRVQ